MHKNALGRSLVFLNGDFNFMVQGEKASRLGISGAALPTVGDSGNYIARSRIWAPTLSHCVECFQDEPTRIGKASNAAGDFYFIATRIDRIYTSLLPLQHTLLNFKTFAIGNISTSLEKTGSDHLPVGVTISVKRSLPVESQPMPRWVAEHALLAKKKFDELQQRVDFEALSPFAALMATKILIKHAGELTEKEAFAEDSSGPAVRMQLILQLSRAIASQDGNLARKVVRDLPELMQIIEVCGDKVWILDQNALDKLTQGVARRAIEVELENANSTDKTSKPRGGRSASLNRKSLLWAPLSRKMLNVATLRSDGTVTQNDDEKAEELAKHWGKTLEEKLIDGADAELFLSEFAGDFHFENIRPPDQNVIEKFVARARHSAPGPDGLPYGAWKSTGSVGSRVLFRVLVELASGTLPPQEFNESLGIYPAQGTSDEDSSTLAKRAASDTRPH